MSAIKQLLKRWFPALAQESRRALMLGLDNSGKTAILLRVAGYRDVHCTIPTIGFNVETCKAGQTQLMIWDVGGCDQMRPLLRYYFDGTSALIFVVDLTDRARLAEAVEYLTMLMTALPDVPVLVLGNKSDMPATMSLADVLDSVKDIAKGRVFTIFPVSAFTSEGLQNAFDWLGDVLNGNACLSGDQPLLPSTASKIDSWLKRQDEADVTFIDQLEDFTLPYWDHYAHLRIAYIYLTTYGRRKGKDMIFSRIEDFIRNSSRTTGKTFSVTLTYFWIQMMDWAIKTTPQEPKSFHLILAMNPFLADGNLPLQYYKKETIYMSSASRINFVPPDIKPLPNVVEKDVLAHETEVKAQIKLRFKNVNGREMVCTRSMSATQKKASLTFKTLESLLSTTDPETGEAHSLSTKCAELDAELPLQLGVSKPILENVIFCHQEESYWPLSEPSNLKRKFDEIFASTRYTKALDNIKALRKEQALQLKVTQNNVEHLKSNKGKAERVRDTLAQIQGKLVLAQQRVTALDGGEIDVVFKDMEALVEKKDQFHRLKNRIEQAKLEHDMLQRSIRELAENMQEYEESDEELINLLNEYEESLVTKERELQDFERQIVNLTSELGVIQEEHTDALTMQGRLQAEAAAQDRRLADRQGIINELSTQLNTVGLANSPVTQAAANQFVDKLRNMLKEQQDSANERKAKAKEYEDGIMSEIQSLRTKHSSHVEAKRVSQRQIDVKRSKIDQYTQQLYNIQSTQADIDALNRRLAEDDLALDKARNNLEERDYETKIRKLKQELQDQEYKATAVSDEMAMLNMQADTRARLSLKKVDLEKKTSALAAAFVEAESAFKDVLGGALSTQTLERDVDCAWDTKQKALKSVENRLLDKNRELSTVDAKLAFVRDNLSKKAETLNLSLQRVRGEIGEADFPTALAEAEQLVVLKRDELSSMRSAESTYKKFLKKSETNQCCPLCERGFPGTDIENFFQKLQTIIDRIPQATRAYQAEVVSAERKRDTLYSLRTTWEDAERLQTVDVAELSKELTEFNQQRESIAGEVENLESELAVLKLEAQSVTQLRQKAKDLSDLQRDATQLRLEVDRLELELKDSGSTRTMGEVQQENDDLQNECKTIRRHIERLTTEQRLKQQEIQSRQNSVRDGREEMQRVQFQLHEREKLQNSIDETTEEIEQLQIEIREAQSQMDTLKPAIEEKESQLLNYRRTISADEANHAGRIASLQQSLDRLIGINTDIQRYEVTAVAAVVIALNTSRRFIEQGGPQQLAECEKRLQSLRCRVENVKTAIAEKSAGIQKIKQQGAGVASLRRQIDDNVRFRQKQRDLRALEESIQRLQKDGAAFDSASIISQYNRLKARHEHLIGERAGLVGESKQMQEQVRRLERELRNDYRDIDLDYQRHLIELKTEEMASSDLEKYARALDTAIMKYHSLKMEEINKIIREIWVNTYQGADIDTIEIRSDNDDAKGNRQYNYRVVMVKSETALDMRGRCSAGQKVLASLIIRLALAETFGLNCGILALDEPTTNLDRENIESLAQSLSNIIAIRRQQSNFQLIVITHDEEFVQMMGRGEYADYYWRVSKDEK
ncbi:DNA repair protein rad50 [Gaertneriomyces sp. JEL0708]|nr:DNA repair protein rad50 [Gaertneriomyces sp. JEL0708]